MPDLKSPSCYEQSCGMPNWYFWRGITFRLTNERRSKRDEWTCRNLNCHWESVRFEITYKALWIHTVHWRIYEVDRHENCCDTLSKLFSLILLTLSACSGYFYSVKKMQNTVENIIKPYESLLEQL